ncbi:Crp/Fnr family transcriptional regulator [Desulfovibrio psychrotolerans]|uniref:Transcriptional regulator n=1 Tax=Desulfovibrio psychrotolerans TaxID=415242 RepID=A0A7J0BR78_9BACT|nr:Crp/Fnr family transcriptional regulator [Desulfovibrio psychrotolerans]GFM36189.1 transcriptional regulator [Desulfovibrio psychrotolerans]
MFVKNVIAHQALFAGLTDEQLTGLASVIVDKPYEKGEVIFVEGTPAKGFYIVAQGRVKIFKSAPDGREAVLHVFGPGEPFGEVAVFQGGTFPAHAMTVEKSRLLFLPRDALVARISSDPTLALNMMAALSGRLRQFAGKIESLTLKETPQRLAAYLITASELKDGADSFSLDIAKGLLAGMLGTARETLSRALGRMVEEGMVAVEGRQITILDRTSLEALAAGVETL